MTVFFKILLLRDDLYLFRSKKLVDMFLDYARMPEEGQKGSN